MTQTTRRTALRLTLAGTAAALLSQGAAAQISDDLIRIGFITDMSSVYADIDGQGGLEAIRMAVADAQAQFPGKKIEVLYADHNNKADVAASKAREWFDTQKLDMLIGGTNSAAALAMAKVAADKKKPFFVIGSGSSRLTNEDCTPFTVHYAYDTVALANGTGNAVIKQGGKTWFFLTADYAFGTSLQADTAAVVRKAGGTVVGNVKHPLNASDFSSFLLQAQASKAQILGLANASGDSINAIKAANEFGVTKTIKIAGLLLFINDIHAAGLNTAQGMYLTDSWYWNQSPAARTWAQKFQARVKRMPSSLQAADYSATATYLKTVAAIGSDDGEAVMKALKSTPIDDFYTKSTIRADGRNLNDMYLMQVKTPAESKEPWDYYKVVQRIPGADAYTKPADSKCPLFK